jgi:hypothetical protein
MSTAFPDLQRLVEQQRFEALMQAERQRLDGDFEQLTDRFDHLLCEWEHTRNMLPVYQRMVLRLTYVITHTERDPITRLQVAEALLAVFAKILDDEAGRAAEVA